jgi:hypothetical protein
VVWGFQQTKHYLTLLEYETQWLKLTQLFGPIVLNWFCDQMLQCEFCRPTPLGIGRMTEFKLSLGEMEDEDSDELEWLIENEGFVSVDDLAEVVFSCWKKRFRSEPS